MHTFFIRLNFICLVLMMFLSSYGAAAVAHKEADEEAIFAAKRASVHKGLEPLKLGGIGPLSIIFGYLEWNKSRPDRIIMDNTESNDYTLCPDGTTLYSHEPFGGVRSHSLISHRSPHRIYSPPPGQNYVAMRRLPNGTLGVILSDSARSRLVTLCHRSSNPTDGPSATMEPSYCYRAHSLGNWIFPRMSNVSFAFDRNHEKPPQQIAQLPGDHVVSLKKIDNQRFITVIIDRDRKNFIQHYNTETLKPIGDRLKIEVDNTWESHHTALLSDTALFFQNTLYAQVIDLYSGKTMCDRIHNMQGASITHILRLKTKFDKAQAVYNNLLVCDGLGRTARITIDGATILSKRFGEQSPYILHAHCKLRQLPYDLIAQSTADHIIIWGLNSNTMIARFSHEMLYPRPYTSPRFLKYHKGTLITADSQGNVALLSPKSDIEMAYHGKQPIITKRSTAPARKETAPRFLERMPAHHTR